MTAPIEPPAEAVPTAPDRTAGGWADALARQVPGLRPYGVASWLVQVGLYVVLPMLATAALVAGLEGALDPEALLGAGAVVAVGVLALTVAASDAADPRTAWVALTPLRPAERTAGLVAAASVRAGAAVLASLVVLLVLGTVGLGRTPWLLAAALLALAAHAPLLVAGAVGLARPAWTVVVRVVVPAVVLFSGALFVLVLPGFVDASTWLLPTRHAVAVGHAAVVGPVDLAVLGHVVVLLAFAAAGGWLAERAVRRSG
ncbi:hypothetical protein CLV56_0428 [Mumia flava]|uniref:ABC-2 type transport system permease protein n=1 Tax=Mumia flava TaxID=1348852 RepID=A0A0B2BLU8_9ACTN|nr:hypothetical protein [Mumia flava]PJJ56224.1 hypothetical protein CLV56_0428 [Mumia flava]